MARKRRQLVIIGKETPGGGSAPLGGLKEVRATLASYNTSADGSKSESGLERLHGPGMVVELPGSIDPVTQAVASINDEDIAFPVLMKLSKSLGWRLMDIESGRVFGV
ncbi:MAG: hypothetical protein GC200_00615 [Tepidisphaera sp.]|nr:hypothetical protein [Tepidisphaera sp.]